MVTSGKERGVALLVALAATLLISMSVTLVALLVQHQQQSVRQAQRAVSCAALADAAMSQTLARLHRNRWYPGLQRKPLAGGWISSTVSGHRAGVCKVTASGEFDSRVAVIEASVDVRSSLPRVRHWTFRQGPLHSAAPAVH